MLPELSRLFTRKRSEVALAVRGARNPGGGSWRQGAGLHFPARILGERVGALAGSGTQALSSWMKSVINSLNRGPSATNVASSKAGP